VLYRHFPPKAEVPTGRQTGSSPSLNRSKALTRNEHSKEASSLNARSIASSSTLWAIDVRVVVELDIRFNGPVRIACSIRSHALMPPCHLDEHDR